MKVNNSVFCNFFSVLHAYIWVSFDLHSDGFASTLMIHKKSGDVVASELKRWTFNRRNPL